MRQQFPKGALISKFGHGGARPNSGGVRAGAGRKPACIWRPLNRDDVPRWYCVRTGHGEERTAALEIGIAGFEVFAPSLWKPASPARRDGGVVRPARVARVESLFPRYLFARFRRSAGNLQHIRELPGVDCILGTAPDSPIALPDAVIELIQGLCSPNGCQYPANVNLRDLAAPIPIEVGSSARLLDGPMADLVGVCQMSAGNRVRLLMSIMGREEVPVTARRRSVEAA